MRKQIVAGNWKMNTTATAAIHLSTEIQEQIAALSLQPHQQVVLCPPALFLQKVKDTVSSLSGDTAENLKIGAQNCHQKTNGAYTGEISAPMLESLGIDYVILGHSERRKYFKEDNTLLKEKVDQALHFGLQIIFCCGESLEIRTANQQMDWVATQIKESLFHLTPAQFAHIVLAYEPIWAIGTGKTASPEQAEAMHQGIRHLLAEQYGQELAANTSILYGGSCKPTNAADLFGKANVDGGLIGGAALKADSFVAIIKCLA